MIFLFQKTIKLIIKTLEPFNFPKFQKISKVFRLIHLPQYENILRKTINISSMYLLVPFIVQDFEKNP